MKNLTTIFVAIAMLGLLSCGGNENEADESADTSSKSATETPTENSTVSDVKPSERIDLTNKGVGPVTEDVVLEETVNPDLALKGEAIFKANCMACHRTDKKYVGPPLKGITERRRPEWIMNMIMDPHGMTQNDPLARELLMEFNGSPMANQNITKEEARQLVEYFRSL
mgnify:CR=1 FL=1